MRAWTLLAACLATGIAAAGTPPPAYLRVAANTGIDPALLYAIAATESARPRYPHPWPWTANISGQAYYYDSRQALYQRLHTELSQGNDRFDVGLMQINWHHNDQLFHSLWQATDPAQNLLIGAQYLQHLFKRSGDMDMAIALYHVGSFSTPARKRRGRQYLGRVRQRLGMSS